MNRYLYLTRAPGRGHLAPELQWTGFPPELQP